MLFSPLAKMLLIPEQVSSTTTRTEAVNESSLNTVLQIMKKFKRTLHDLGLYILGKICELTDQFLLG